MKMFGPTHSTSAYTIGFHRTMPAELTKVMIVSFLAFLITMADKRRYLLAAQSTKLSLSSKN